MGLKTVITPIIILLIMMIYEELRVISTQYTS